MLKISKVRKIFGSMNSIDRFLQGGRPGATGTPPAAVVTAPEARGTTTTTALNDLTEHGALPPAQATTTTTGAPLQQLPAQKSTLPALTKPGWIDEAARFCKLRNDPRSVNVETPNADYFVRGVRKVPGKVPAVFLHELFMVITPHVNFSSGKTDCVCMRCFESFKTPDSGQHRLKMHALKCYGSTYCDSLDLDGNIKPGDKRRGTTGGSVLCDFDTKMTGHILASRWIAGTGRASATLDDVELCEWVEFITHGSYRPPSSFFAGGSGELTAIDYDGMVSAIEADLHLGERFYSGEAFLWEYADL